MGWPKNISCWRSWLLSPPWTPFAQRDALATTQSESFYLLANKGPSLPFWGWVSSAPTPAWMCFPLPWTRGSSRSRWARTRSGSSTPPSSSTSTFSPSTSPTTSSRISRTRALQPRYNSDLNEGKSKVHPPGRLATAQPSKQSNPASLKQGGRLSSKSQHMAFLCDREKNTSSNGNFRFSWVWPGWSPSPWEETSWPASHQRFFRFSFFLQGF